MDLEKQVNKKIRLIKEMNISEKNRDLILEYNKELEIKGRHATVRLQFLRLLSELGKGGSFKMVKNGEIIEPAGLKKNIMNYLAKLKKRGLEESTLMSYKVKTKQFFRWAYKMKRGNYPDAVDWIEIKNVDAEHSEKDLLTWEDAFLLAKFADNARDACLPVFMLETGARINEILDMRIKHLKIINPQLATVTLKNSKRGLSKKYREIEVSKSVQRLMGWKDLHPRKTDPEAFFWCNLAHNYDNSQLTPQGVYKTMKKLASRATLKKLVNPHWWRHSSASFYGQFYNEAQLRDRFGWIKDSKSPSQYCHTSGERNKFREVSGLKQPEESKPFEIPDMPVCNTCGSYIGEIRGQLPEICPRCNNPWDKKAISEEMEEMKADMKKLMEYVKGQAKAKD